MNWATLIFGYIVLTVNYYADLYLENDRNAMTKTEKFVKNFNLPIPEYFDFIIVGGGGAGCLVANRLARANFSVLLVEAGGNPPPPLSVPGNTFMYSEFENILYKYKSIEQGFRHSPNRRKINTLMGKVLGGTTAWNYMFFNRGSPYDFDNWANITGDDSWNYHNFLKYFKATETYLGDHDSDEHGTNGGMPVSTSVYAPEELSEYLDIRRYATAEKILIDSDTREAYGVQYLRHGFPQLAYAKKEVILSAGSFGSPLLLMRSGIGPEADLEALNISVIANLPVGRHYYDHPIFPLAVELDRSLIYDSELNLTESSMTEYLEQGIGPLTTPKGLSGQSFLASSKTKAAGFPDWADIQIAFYFHDDKIFPGPPKVYLWVHLARPKSSGSVKLDPNDIHGSPLIHWNMLSTEYDYDVLVEGIKKGLEVFENTKVFKAFGASYPDTPLYGCTEHQFRSDGYWKCYISNSVISGGHSCGTCPMGKASDPNSVVDSKLKVIGIEKLRVMDVSIMPAIPNANLQAVVLGIAEKGVATILEEHLNIGFRLCNNTKEKCQT